MPYKYVKDTKNTFKDGSQDPVIIESKELIKSANTVQDAVVTEEEHQEKITKEHEKQFFEEDDEILEVTWD